MSRLSWRADGRQRVVQYRRRNESSGHRSQVFPLGGRWVCVSLCQGAMRHEAHPSPSCGPCLRACPYLGAWRVEIECVVLLLPEASGRQLSGGRFEARPGPPARLPGPGKFLVPWRLPQMHPRTDRFLVRPSSGTEATRTRSVWFSAGRRDHSRSSCTTAPRSLPAIPALRDHLGSDSSQPRTPTADTVAEESRVPSTSRLSVRETPPAEAQTALETSQQHQETGAVPLGRPSCSSIPPT